MNDAAPRTRANQISVLSNFKTFKSFIPFSYLLLSCSFTSRTPAIEPCQTTKTWFSDVMDKIGIRASSMTSGDVGYTNAPMPSRACWETHWWRDDRWEPDNSSEILWKAAGMTLAQKVVQNSSRNSN